MDERKIGEVFEVDNKKVKCVIATSLCQNNGNKCSFQLNENECSLIIGDRCSLIVGCCLAECRTDDENVCFIEVK